MAHTEATIQVAQVWLWPECVCRVFIFKAPVTVDSP